MGLRGQVHSTEEGAIVTKVIDDSNRAADQVASRRQLEPILVTLIPECLQPDRFAWL